MRRTSPLFLASLLLLSSCASLQSALDTGLLGGKSAIHDKNQIQVDTVNFPGSTILSVAGVPGKHAFVLIRTGPSGLLLEELDVKTGKTDWSADLRLPFQPAPRSVVADSRGRVFIFPSQINRFQKKVAV